MKAKIIREINVKGLNYYMVYANDEILASFAYRAEVPDDDIYSEKKNYEAAYSLAKRIEAGEKKMLETIYETPKPETI